ncbi:hypothetical protein NA57DRAFT_60697 [Rhizodiscina lignyota]|uniref:Uncharacterized protein n=1 Tax=Rhizodiscina lignyota TaxID=1504668 RepID=A0A9P4M1X2_9PEZI|nr:hypothetical protein NA57DRAFT_60697 [Rhizodiscina lignyota]
MSDRNTTDPSTEPSPAAAGRRRSSFAGMMDLFGSRTNGSNSPPVPGSSMSHAAAQAQQRRLSITTVGLGSSTTAPSASPFGTMRSRGQSISSSGSGSVDESPFEEADGPPLSSNPTSPFARRLSFGARALRDVRTGSGSGGGGGNNANGRPSVIHTTASDRKPTVSPPTAKGREGFNFAENMRARAERGSVSNGVGVPSPPMHGRAKSVAVMEPPVREMPVNTRKPDQFQERILKGDFYMD